VIAPLESEQVPEVQANPEAQARPETPAESRSDVDQESQRTPPTPVSVRDSAVENGVDKSTKKVENITHDATSESSKNKSWPAHYKRALLIS